MHIEPDSRMYLDWDFCFLFKNQNNNSGHQYPGVSTYHSGTKAQYSEVIGIHINHKKYTRAPALWNLRPFQGAPQPSK